MRSRTSCSATRPPSDCVIVSRHQSFETSVAIVLGEEIGGAAGAATGNDRHLVNRVGIFEVGADNRVTRFVKSGQPARLLLDEFALFLGAEDDFVLGLFHFFHRHFVFVVPCGKKRSLVDHVGQVGAAHPGGRTGGDGEVDVVGEGDFARMDLEDSLSAFDIRHVDNDPAIESTRPEKSGVEHIGPVRRCEKNDTLVALEPVHLDEQLVERLLALVMPAAKPRSAVPADGIDFIYKQDTWRVFFPLVEEIPDAGGAHTDKHFDKVRTAHGEERDGRFTGDGFGEQGLSCSRRPEKEGALGNPTAEPLEFLGITEKLDNFLEFFLGLVGAGDVIEGDPRAVATKHPCPALSETKCLISTRLHLSHDQEP